MNVDYKDTFKYFSSIHPDISKGTVLDYGSNSGTFLKSAGLKFAEGNYTGIDVDNSSVIVGQELFPTAKFIHYNTFNHMYNPQGIVNFSLPLAQTYDTIISYSVFTHTTEEDILSRIEELYNFLNVGGKLIFTYLNVGSTGTVKYFTDKRTKNFGYCDIISTETKLYLVDADIKQYPIEGKMLATFYNTAYLKSILSGYSVTSHQCPTGCYNCIQDCIVINK